jgi:hypothetical protein
MLNHPIVPKDGCTRAPELPGPGIEIKPEVWHPAAITRTTAL